MFKALCFILLAALEGTHFGNGIPYGSCPVITFENLCWGTFGCQWDVNADSCFDVDPDEDWFEKFDTLQQCTQSGDYQNGVTDCASISYDSVVRGVAYPKTDIATVPDFCEYASTIFTSFPCVQVTGNNSLRYCGTLTINVGGDTGCYELSGCSALANTPSSSNYNTCCTNTGSQDCTDYCVGSTPGSVDCHYSYITDDTNSHICDGREVSGCSAQPECDWKSNCQPDYECWYTNSSGYPCPSTCRSKTIAGQFYCTSDTITAEDEDCILAYDGTKETCEAAGCEWVAETTGQNAHGSWCVQVGSGGSVVRVSSFVIIFVIIFLALL